MPKPKILQVFSVPISLRFLEGQTLFWQNHGFDIHVACSDGVEVVPFCLKNKATFHVIPFVRNLYIFEIFRCVASINKLLKTLSPQIIHANTPFASYITIFVAKFHSIPVRIYEVHGLPLETASGLMKPILWFLEKITCCFATKVIAVSPSLKALMISKKLINPNKIEVMNLGSCNGVDSDFKFNPSKLVKNDISFLKDKYKLNSVQNIVGFIGRLTYEKGIHELYEAWQLTKTNFPNSKLLIIGSNDERRPLSKFWLGRLTTDSSIICVEHAEDIENYYALIDFLVLPSHREGFGNVILEAASMKKSAIVSYVTGLKDAIIENETGMFFDCKDSSDLSKKILFYLENPEIVQKHGISARKRVQTDFKPTDIWERKLETYREGLRKA